MTRENLLLEVKDLKTYFYLDEGTVKAVDGVDFDLVRGKTLCVVGESGCGKSVTARSILQIVDRPGRVVEGEMLFYRTRQETSTHELDDIVDLAKMEPNGREMRNIRGKEIAMIFQEPMTSLSPVHTIGYQIMEAITLHNQVTKQEAREQTIEMLGRVGIPRPETRVDAYPFQLSGGMRQRAMIAMALSCHPSLLIADEPTTALDVTTQAQILDLMLRLQSELGMAIMFITHDLGVVAEIADEVVVMYLGVVVERGSVDTIFHDPKHPYTQALLRSIPQIGPKAQNGWIRSKAWCRIPTTGPKAARSTRAASNESRRVCDRVMPERVHLDENHEVRCLLYGGNVSAQDPQGGAQ